jgi:hypothetical protein
MHVSTADPPIAINAARSDPTRILLCIGRKGGCQRLSTVFFGGEKVTSDAEALGGMQSYVRDQHSLAAHGALPSDLKIPSSKGEHPPAPVHTPVYCFQTQPPPLTSIPLCFPLPTITSSSRLPRWCKRFCTNPAINSNANFVITNTDSGKDTKKVKKTRHQH